jgi:glutathione-regulated potassium-efflux system ancillary protein KefC
VGLRRPIFGWGSVQVLGCAALLITALGMAAGRALAAGAGGGAGPGLSSTAIGLGCWPNAT